MAQINFPVATANGQEFEADNGVIYTYVGTPPNGYWSGTFQNESYTTLDGRYLKLDSSNDPVTGGLNITGGNVGIETSSPSALLEIAGGSPSNGVPTLYLSRGADQSNTSDITLTSNAVIRSENSIRSVVNDSGIFTWSIGGTDAKSGTTGSTEAMRISSSGNVGIGTTSPSEKLVLSDVAETSGFSDTAISMIRSNYGGRIAGYIDQGVGHGITIDTINNATPSERMRITGDGNVGINTTDPGSTLSIRDGDIALIDGQNVSNAGHSIRFFGAGVDDNSTNYAEIKGALSSHSSGQTQSGHLIFSTSGIERMRITSDGKVGIGATNPANYAGTCHFVVKNSGGTRIGLEGSSRRWYLETRSDIDGFSIGARGSNNTVDNPKLTVLTSGGITFGNDTATANALDDYEEGTWTPAFTGGTFTYTNQTGKYTKIGDMVYLSATIAWSAKSGTSNLSSAIPFTTKGVQSQDRYSGMIGYVDGIDTAGDRQLVCTISGNRTGVGFYLLRDNNNANATTVQNANSSGEIQFSFVVKVQ